jgi:sugar-specific transcriptional regulator TrmB
MAVEDPMVVKQIEEAIMQLESEIEELKQSLADWDRTSINLDGSRKYRGNAKRIVLQSQKVEELIKANSFSR